MNNGGRPDPDALLARVQQEEARAARGKLKIFFGASAGVGKTYAMLGAARRQQELGVDVLDTHIDGTRSLYTNPLPGLVDGCDSARANCSPSPLEAPVTKATRPDRSIS